MTRMLEDLRLQSRPRLTAWSHLAFLAWTLLMAGLMPSERLPYLLVSVTLLSVLLGGRPWIALVNPRLWILLVSIVFISGLVLGQPDLAWMGIERWIGLSSEGLLAGLWMGTRAVCITLGFAGSLGALSVGEMSHLFERLGMKGLGFALGVALNMTSVVGDVISVAFHSMRLRGGFRRQRLRNCKRMLVAAISSVLRHGDDVVLAATARAFDPERDARQPAPLFLSDYAFLCTLAGLITILLLLPRS